MISIIAAGAVFGLTLLICSLTLFAGAMSDTTGTAGSPLTWVVFCVGTGISAMLLAVHWM